MRCQHPARGGNTPTLRRLPAAPRLARSAPAMRHCGARQAPHTVLETARSAGETAATILIGPEGDFSPAEYAAAAQAGYLPTSLGPIILRVETAVFMAVAATRYALDR